MSNEAVIVAAARTPIGKAPRGSLRHTRPDDLAAMSIQAVLARCPAVDPQEIEDVIFGCATPEGESGMNIARVAALRAGLSQSTPGATVNRFCASGLEAVAIAAERICAGDADIILAGGVESMSRVPFLDIRTHPNPTLFRDAPNTYLSMGLSVEQLARKYGITREQADAFALQSHQKAVRAQDEGLFDAEIAPVQTEVQTVDACGRPQRETITLTCDEGPRRDTSMEALAKLKPAFRADGIITAGNASQRSDGAAAVLVMRARKADALGIKPLLRFMGYTTAALTPEDFGVAPAYAIPKLLRRTGVGIDAIDHIEFNEAFAAQVLASNCIFEMPMARVNPLGGAIALGHPLGCTGARQVVTLAYALQRTGGRYGLVTMCAALGMGAAGLFERV
ncbi:thiolase family protein [Synechococcus sp. RC10B2]|uniref:thiolase family protein n=1 Tax=Synechococcus sp. RC10B2 TaxID=2964530 RepID=UPI0039C6601B